MIFAVYKPKGPTSNQILNRLRRAAGTKKMGHAGTLDPLAEGVLVVGVGREATKNLAKEVAKEKEYKAVIRLGITSTTDDEEGDKSERSGYDVPNQKRIKEILRRFGGDVWQTPPLYSAVKIKGKEAYKHARRGERVVLEPRRVLIKHITVESYTWPVLTLKIITGPGVYVRALARDIGEALDTGAYLTGLIRTRVGQWTIKNALSLDEAIRKSIV